MLPLLTALSPIVGQVIEKVLPDAVEKDRVKAELSKAFLEHSSDIEKAAASVVVAEAQGESFLQRNWRPITMLVFLSLLVLYWFDIKPQNLTEAIILEIFSMIKIGVSGYIVSRSAEKGIKTWVEGKK